MNFYLIIFCFFCAGGNGLQYVCFTTYKSAALTCRVNALLPANQNQAFLNEVEQTRIVYIFVFGFVELLTGLVA